MHNLMVFPLPWPHSFIFTETVFLQGQDFGMWEELVWDRFSLLYTFPNLVILIKAEGRKGEGPEKFSSVCMSMWWVYECPMHALLRRA